MFYLTLSHFCRVECGKGFSSLISSSTNFLHSFDAFFFDLLLAKFGGPLFALPSLESSRRTLLVLTLLTNLSEPLTGQHLRTKFNPSACNANQIVNSIRSEWLRRWYSLFTSSSVINVVIANLEAKLLFPWGFVFWKATRIRTYNWTFIS